MLDRTRTIWAPQPGPQTDLIDCPFPEVFFGGARGGGKTDGVLGKWATKDEDYGDAFNAVAFRRTSVSFEDAIERAKQVYLPLGATFTDRPPRFRMPNGGRVSFAYLESVQDAAEYQGRNLTDTWIEEAGQYPSPEPIDRLFGALRSAQGVPTQQILTANPGGPGQSWLAQRYKLIPFPTRPRIVSRHLPDGSRHDMAVIPSRITDNRILLDSDPGYSSRLQLVGGAALVKAWLNGDWSAIEGAFFAEWDEAKHVVEPFAVPRHWARFRSFDWGSAKPFSVGWWAVVSDPFPIPGRAALPRGALVRYREWYGSSGPNVGLKLTTEEVASGILDREDREESFTHSVADPAIFAEDGGPSRSEVFGRHDVWFTRADNRRVGRDGAMGGWDEMRQRLKGEDGVPMVYCFSTCRDSIRTIPVLQHDVTHAEDLDSSAEDHAADEWRYGMMSRPWVREKPVPQGLRKDDAYAPAQREANDTWFTTL